MSQASSFGVKRSGPESPVDMFTRLDENLDAFLTCQSGSSRPSYAAAGTLWLDTTSAPWLLKQFDGNDDITLARINATDNTVEWVESAEQDLASASTCDLGSKTGRNLRITGTTTITSFGTSDAGVEKRLRFAGALTLTHNATSLILPGGANITTAAGDVAVFRSEGSGNWRCVGYTKANGQAVVQPAAPASASEGLFYKADHEAVAFTKTGNGTASLKAGTKLWVDNQVWNFDTAEPITMPTLVAGTDLYVWLHPDGTVEATTSPTTPPVANARKIGGFHYAPGGMATGFNTGGNTTPQIIDTTFWDLKWRSKCGDQRGINYWAPAANAPTGGFWLDMYLLGVNHIVDGTSAYNVTIADGSSPPKIPLMFGGDGSADYGGFTKFEAIEVFASHGKQLMSYDEFMVAAFGADEAASGGTDPVSTILRAAYTSRHMFLASGNMWILGRDFGGPDSGASWNTSTEGRGSVYNQPNAALLGGTWDSTAFSGSRASNWSLAPSASNPVIGARGRSDHLCLL